MSNSNNSKINSIQSFKIPAPNFTMTPNELFDHWLPHLGLGEIRVLLVVIRKTFGWHKPRDNISISQLEKFTGLSRANVIISIKKLIEKGLIEKEITGIFGKEETYYSLIVSPSDDQYCNNTPTSIEAIPPPVLQQYPQNKPLKETSKITTTTPTPPSKVESHIKEKVVVVVSKSEISEKAKHIASQCYITGEVRGEKWKISPEKFMNLLRYYTKEFICDVLNYMLEQDKQAELDEKSSKSKKTPRIEKPFIYLTKCLKENWCLSEHAKFTVKVQDS